MDSMQLSLFTNDYIERLQSDNHLRLDPTHRVLWEKETVAKIFKLTHNYKGTMDKLFACLSSNYSVRYYARCTTSPPGSKQPQTSVVFQDELGNMQLLSVPMSCQEFLRNSIKNAVTHKDLDFSSLRVSSGPLRLFFEMPPALERPTMRMKRAFRMAQSLTEFIGEDPSKVRLYRAKLPELKRIEQKVLAISFGEPVKEDFRRLTNRTGTMFLNRDRMYVLEAPEIWIKSPYALSVFGRLTRNALFKRPLLFKNYKVSENFVEALRQWEGLVKTEKGWRDAFRHLKETPEALSQKTDRRKAWKSDIKRASNFYTTVGNIGINRYIGTH